MKLANNAIIGIVAEALHELLALCARGGIAVEDGVARGPGGRDDIAIVEPSA